MAYLRALAKRESNLNPSSGGGSYWGILQVGINNVLPSYNKRRGTNYSANDLFDPDVCVKIAADLLNRIVVAFGKHPSPNMKENWSNPEFVRILTAGWNSGYSEAAGVGRVASWLEARGIPVTHDTLFKYAAQAGGTRFLQQEQYDKKRVWQKSVADLYFQQPDAGKAAGGLLALAVVGFFAWAAYRLI